MRTRFAQFSDSSLLEHLAVLAARDRGTTAALLDCMSEVDTRRLYLAEGYSSMFKYCTSALRMSDDIAYKRILVARKSRRFPRILAAIADGRLNLTSVVKLAPHLTQTTADDLLTAAEFKTKSEIELLLAQRFPRPDLPTILAPLPSTAIQQLVPEPVATTEPATPTGGPRGEPGVLASLSTASVAATTRVTPLAPRRFALQSTIDDELEALLREAHELRGHLTATSHVPEILKDAMRDYVARLRRQKHGATETPRTARRCNPDSRHIPHEVKRAVWQRDGGQCTHTSESGHRCEERSGLEYDHVIPYARGGDASVSNIRLRCAAHNRYEAERTFGVEFMRSKREAKRAAGTG